MEKLIRKFMHLSLLLGLVFTLANNKVQTAPTAAVNFDDVQNNEYVANHTYTTPSVSTEIKFTGNVTFDGDVVFRAEPGKRLTISIDKNSLDPSSQVIFKPFTSTPSAPNKYAHLIFEPDAGGTIVVDLYRDLILAGNNINNSLLPVGADPLDYESTRLFVSFRGKGTTIFNLANGKRLVLTSLQEAAGNTLVEMAPPTSVSDRKGEGVSMFVVMDQNNLEAVKQGLNKVVFQRKDFFLTGSANNEDCVVDVGPNSLFTFVSHNYTGLDSSLDPLNINIPLNSDGTYLESYAAVAFDVSNAGKGRMVLNVRGPVTEANTYSDGAFSLCGNYMQDRADNLTALPGAYTNNDALRKFINFSQPAGCRAFLRVIDNQMYLWDLSPQNTAGSHYVDSLLPSSGEVGVVNGKLTRRSLLVRCTNKSIAPLASNPFGDSSWYYQEVFNSGRGSTPVRPGFVLGINGCVEVAHNTFLEYEAGSPNQSFEPFNLGMVALDNIISGAGFPNPLNLFKQRNPSALVVDGLGAVIESNIDQIKFLAHNKPSVVRRAEIVLYGNASMTVRAPLIGTVVSNTFVPTKGLYDGKRLAINGETSDQDGIFVLDVEGTLAIRSFEDSVATIYVTGNSYGWHAGSNYPAAGAFRLGSLWRSYDDREIVDLNELPLSSYVARPLLITSTPTYSRYEKPTILLNDKIDLINLQYHHEDVSRFITVNVNDSSPVICAGERANYLQTIFNINAKPYIPLIRLYNSKIHCHESMCLTGLRLIVRELPDILSVDGNIEPNTSSLVMYNHGFALDTQINSRGRVFLMGSKLNRTPSGATFPLLESAYMSIFRDSGGDPITGANPTNLSVALNLETAPEIPADASPEEKATHLFFLGNDSNVEVGWSSEVGIYKDNNDITVYPWDHRLASEITLSSNTFNLDATQEQPATLRFKGDFIYLGGRGPNGEGAPTNITGYDLGRVIYMGHGSKIEIVSDLTNPVNPRPYRGYTDATIAVRLFKTSKPGLSAQINLPQEQFTFLKSPIVPFGIDMSTLTDSVINNTDPSFNNLWLTKLAAGVSTIVISWDKVVKRADSIIRCDPVDTLRSDFRTNNRTLTPIVLPNRGLLYSTDGDIIDMLAVSGATQSNKFDYYVTGAKSKGGGGIVREFSSIASTTFVPGEGAFANLVVDNGGQIGLGTRDNGQLSVNSWMVVGRNMVTIIPNGDGRVNLNSNIILGDSQPLIPTTGFGSQYIDSSSQTILPTHQIKFYSEAPLEIRVPTGKELDLSAFGQATTSSTATQQISIGGKVKLIFEPGSALRFPDLTGANVDKQPILYLNEDAELVFESIQDMDNKFIDNANYSRWNHIRDSDRAKVRLLGVGQIWVNKTAVVRINDGAIAAVEVDDLTPHTDITISLQREGVLELGNANVLGGSLQVGNPHYKADNSAYTVPTGVNVPTPYINFTLRLNSENCRVNMGRNSYMGFGVGVVDRFEQVPNGRWKLQGLNYVNNINLRVIAGTFSHNQIYDGSAAEGKESSLMAIGPVSGKYKFEFGPQKSVLLGGGNLLFAARPASATDFITVNITNLAVAINDGSSADSGKYSIVNSSPVLQMINSNRNSFIAKDPATTTLSFINNVSGGPINPPAGQARFSESLLNGGFGFSGSQRDAFTYLAAKDVYEQFKERQAFVMLGKNLFEKRIGYMLKGVLVRSTDLSLENGVTSADVDMVKVGVLQTSTFDTRTGAPGKNKLPV